MLRPFILIASIAIAISIVAAILMVGAYCNSKIPTDQTTEIVVSDSLIAYPIKRYFIIGFNIENTDRTKAVFGNYQWVSYDIPNQEQIRKEIFNSSKLDMDGLKFKNLTIIGFHEFKDSIDCAKFYNKQK